jgi:hypothetical protein
MDSVNIDTVEKSCQTEDAGVGTDNSEDNIMANINNKLKGVHS